MMQHSKEAQKRHTFLLAIYNITGIQCYIYILQLTAVLNVENIVEASLNIHKLCNIMHTASIRFDQARYV